ncbi:MerR family transcriptional regulator [Streptomyces sp. YIM 130001]|uniref:transcriptional regulator FtsR n=1 Tax=Streptomyces sp. YIM 130001 TaxID=2259644 RepID=UPI000E650C37|nr:MerR family transcriptional regulator [Streptomyces sp. YIM 130001]
MLHTPRGGAGQGAATAESRLMSIGTALNLLRDEFPEVTISKIRFLESEGLVEPVRTPSGYRKFSPEDVERLAQVLRMQRDHYLPLKVIREHLVAVERGEAAVPSVPERRQPGDGDSAGTGGRTVALVGRSELLAAAQVEESELAEWESYGLLAPASGGGYPRECVEVAKLLAALGGLGIEPRHLRAMKGSADREALLVDQLVGALRRHRNPKTRAAAEERTKELARLTVELHAALVQVALKVRLP